MVLESQPNALMQPAADMDFLETPYNGQISPRDAAGISLVEELDILRDIRTELRKTHPSQRCVPYLEFRPNRGTGLLTASSDICRIWFRNNGKQVKSQYLIIGNASDGNISVTLNEPLQFGVSTLDGNGIGINAVGGGGPTVLTVQAEIEFVEVRFISAGGKLVAVNNSAPVPANGVITVYGWTIPEQSQMP